ncbi:sensor histidine kinase [Alkalibacillus salilacus]|uniref:histidine kinase n=1 Tax=Alkalibacillus salilacus TaxID=284582 RepID=A0ABT9VBL4_9BACI|nr:sensor histidine kinase [Alkalibacillus salilacus]MDQ0158205.1 signal transduction histidine kinase [Alkalibacillus salilacus]
MKQFIIWIVLHIIFWGVLISPFFTNVSDHIWRISGVAVYFTLMFMTPLFRDKQRVLVVIFASQIMLITSIFFPFGAFNYYLVVWLVLALVLVESAVLLSFRAWLVVMAFSLLPVVSLIMRAEMGTSLMTFVLLYMTLLLTGVAYYHWQNQRHRDLINRYEELSSDFRQLKRRVTDQEELVRQEERHMIGQEIHDSVGHKLTSMIMQIEAIRLTSESVKASETEQLKALAEDSLNETRKAVQTFKQKEVGGLQGVLRLIRKLELESFIQIHFSVKHGAFAAPLTGEQSFVVYRCVQEGLTNIMKHSQARHAQITFDAPGGSLFRFEIVNPIENAVSFENGYGLKSMQERLEKVGGGVKAYHVENEFVLKAWIYLNEREG